MSKQISLHPVARTIFAQRLPALAALLVPGLAAASPTGGSVVAGQAGIATPGAGATVINQSSQNAIINWQQFNIGGNEYVIFNQPNASAAVLNRVISGGASEILGSLSANGRVFLINPQGVIFGKGAQVDVGGLVATTMNIADRDFMAGRYVFANGTQAPVSNAGVINAANGGFVVLAGDYVNNTGVIQAKLGDVVLASGSAMTLDLAGDGLINLSVDQRALSERAGVSNLGEIAAQGGNVVMTAKVARGLAATAVNNSGVISANGITERGGDIFLTADGGNVANNGTLDVSGGAGYNGGSIEVRSDGDVLLNAGSVIDASGANGGAMHAIAGQQLTLAPGAQTTIANTSATGRGGFAELSGQTAVIRDVVDLGRGGQLLIDPVDVTIGPNPNATYNQQSLESQLQSGNGGSNVSIVATNSITVQTLSGGLLEGRNINGTGAGLNLLIGSCSASCDTTFIPGGTSTSNISFQTPTDTIAVDGALKMDAGAGFINVGTLASTNLAITLNAGQNIQFGSLIVGSTSAIAPTAVNINSQGGNVNGGSIGVAAGSLGSTLNITASKGSVSLAADPSTGLSIVMAGGGGSTTLLPKSNAATPPPQGYTVANATILAGQNISLAGGVSMNGLATAYTGTGTFADGSPLTTSGSAGAVFLDLEAQNVAINGTDSSGNSISLAGVGATQANLESQNSVVVKGNISIAASADTESYTKNGLSVQEHRGLAIATLSNLLPPVTGPAGTTTQANNPAGSISAGNIKVVGPEAFIDAEGGTLNLGNGSGTALSTSALTTNGYSQQVQQNGVTTFTDNAARSFITLISAAGSGATPTQAAITVNGNATSNGARAGVEVSTDGGLVMRGSVSVTGSGYTISGSNWADAANTRGNHACILSPCLSGPPPLSQGTVRWGQGTFDVSGNTSQFAGSVQIFGDVNVAGIGTAQAVIDALSLSIGHASTATGTPLGHVNIDAASAGSGTVQGSYNATETHNGVSYTATHNVSNGTGGPALFGAANFDFNSSGGAAANFDSLGISVTGFSANAHFHNANNVNVAGDVAVTGGQAVLADHTTFAPVKTTDPALAPVDTMILGDTQGLFVGDVGKAVPNSGGFSANNIAISGFGVVALVLDSAGGSNIGGNVTVQDSTGNFTQNGVVTPFTYAGFDSGSASSITGNLTVNTPGALLLGGKTNVTGSAGLSATGNVSDVVPAFLLNFDHPFVAFNGVFVNSGTKTPQTDLTLPAINFSAGTLTLNYGTDSTLSSALNLSAASGLNINGNGRKLTSAGAIKLATTGNSTSNIAVSAANLNTPLTIDMGSAGQLSIANTAMGGSSLSATNVTLSSPIDVSAVNSKINATSQLTVTSGATFELKGTTIQAGNAQMNAPNGAITDILGSSITIGGSLALQAGSLDIENGSSITAGTAINANVGAQTLIGNSATDGSLLNAPTVSLTSAGIIRIFGATVNAPSQLTLNSGDFFNIQNATFNAGAARIASTNPNAAGSTFVQSQANVGGVATISTVDPLIVSGSTFNAHNLNLTSSNNLTLQSDTITAATTQVFSNGAGKNIAINASTINTGGDPTALFDLNVSSAGSVTIAGSTFSDSSGGVGQISVVNGSGASSIGTSTLNFSGTVNIGVAGAGTSLSLNSDTFGTPAGNGANLAINADNSLTVGGSTFNVHNLGVISNNGNVTLQNDTVTANNVQIASSGVGKNVAVNSSTITTNGGITNGDFSINAGAGNFTIAGSTFSDLSGGSGQISASGNGTTSSIGGSVLNFSGPLRIAVTGTGSGLSISGGRIGPSTTTAVALIAKVATTPGDVSISSSGNLSLNTIVNANNLTLTAGDTLRLIGSATAVNSFLSGTNAVIANVPGFTLTTSALGVQSTAGYIDLTNSSISVGTGVTTLGQDPAMLANLGMFAPTALGPNAAFVATGGTNGTVSLGNLNLAGDYLFVRGLSASFNGSFLPTANSLFYNFVPVHLDAGISIAGIENLVNSYAQTRGPNAVLTLAFGSSQFTGPVLAGSAAAPINVGTPANFVFVTTNAVQGYDAIQTKGAVATLNSGVLSIRPPPPPPATQQQGQDASFAATNTPPPNGDPNKKKQVDQTTSPNSTTDSGKGEVEHHTHEAVLDKSCT